MLKRESVPEPEAQSIHCAETIADSDAQTAASVTRRRFLAMGVAGTTSGLIIKRFRNLAVVDAQAAAIPLNPDTALQQLMEGNRRFTAGKLLSIDHDLRILKENTVEKQEPFASVLACADSRVPVEWIFDQTIGHLFVNRVAGNIITSEITASLEYGVAVLETPVVVIMGHSHCGAVKAAVQNKEVPGQISALFPRIRPAITQVNNGATADLEAVGRQNAIHQAKLLRESSPLIASRVKQGKVKVLAAYYDLASGKVSLLES
jgi:carbonic anhydrase